LVTVVEDDAVFAESMIDLLESEGFLITHVKDGEAALDATYNSDYDMYLFERVSGKNKSMSIDKPGNVQ